MQNNLSKKIIFTVLAVFLGIGSALQGVDYKISQIYNSEKSLSVTDVNNFQVAMYGVGEGAQSHEIYLFDGKEIVQLTNNSYPDYSAQFSGDSIFWSGYPNGSNTSIEYFRYKDNQITQLTNTRRYKDSFKTDSGQAVWSESVDGDYEIFFYNGTSVVQLTNNDIADYSPDISKGEIVWYSYDNAQSKYYINYYNGSEIIQLTDGSLYVSSPRIYRGFYNVNIVWTANDRVTYNNEIYYYNGTSISQITDNDDNEVVPDVDNNIIVWYVQTAKHFGELYVYQYGSITRVSEYSNNFTISNSAVTWHDATNGNIMAYVNKEIVTVAAASASYYGNIIIDDAVGSSLYHYFAWNSTEYSPSQRTSVMFAKPKIELPGDIEMENYDLGGEGVAYHDADVVNNGGVFRNGGVDLQECSLVRGSPRGGSDPEPFNLGWIEAGEWLNYTVDVTMSGNYALGFGYASLNGGGSLHLEVDGTPLTGVITIPSTGGWQEWRWMSVSDFYLTQGEHVVKVVFDTAGFNLDYISFTKLGDQWSSRNLAIPGTIEAEDYDFGGMNVAYFDSDLGNNGNGSYRMDNVDIEICSNSGYNIGYINEGEWLEYTIADVNAGRYDIVFDIASGDNITAKNITVKLGDSVLGTVSPYYTGGWQTWQQAVIRGVNLSGGTDQVLRLEFGGSSYNLDKIRFVPVPLNMVNNGNFSGGLSSWATYIDSQANASINANNGYAAVTIYYGNYESWYVQLFQGGMNLETGKTYEVAFDVCSSGHIVSGQMDVHVEENGGDYTQYMQKQTVYFGPNWTHFSFTFTMNESADADARITFNMGKFTSGWGSTYLNIDNVSLMQK